jgi:hypothetical protein
MARGLFRLSLAVSAALLTASCSTNSNFLADNLPDWAGGLPRGTPPRAGAPGYDEYQRSIHGDPAAPASTPADEPPANASARSGETPPPQPIH